MVLTLVERTERYGLQLVKHSEALTNQIAGSVSEDKIGFLCSTIDENFHLFTSHPILLKVTFKKLLSRSSLRYFIKKSFKMDLSLT